MSKDSKIEDPLSDERLWDIEKRFARMARRKKIGKKIKESRYDLCFTNECIKG